MRLTSDFWAAAFIRSVRCAGGFAYLARRGAEEAGAIFIKQAISAASGAEAQAALYGPAPQSLYDEDEANTAGNADRMFIRLMTGDEAALAARLERELDFDSDIWIIEVENFPDISLGAHLRLIRPEHEIC